MVYYIYNEWNTTSTPMPMVISTDLNYMADDFSTNYPLFLLSSSLSSSPVPFEPQELSVLSSDSATNNPNNGDPSQHQSHSAKYDNLGAIFHTVGLGVTLAALILTTIVGNVFVIIAILMEKNLRTVGNYLVLSLAIADLMVACLVMPLGAVYEVSSEWILGPQWCDIWTCADVLCCTASILHLLAIAIDRYWAVTNIDYIHNRNPNRIGALIICIWTIASIISIAPILGWKDPDFEKRLLEEKKCLVSQDIAYQIVATFATFYGPLVFILLLYWRIYQVARLRIRRKPGTRIVLNVKNNTCDTTKNLSVPCNVEVTTTNFSSDMSTNTTVTTTTASNPSPERSFASQRFSVCPSIASQVIDESSIIQVDNNINANTSISPPNNVHNNNIGSVPGCENNGPSLNNLTNNNNGNNVVVECTRNHLSASSSPAKECLIPPMTPSNCRSGPSTPSNMITIEKEKYTNISETCDGSTIDIDDDWNLIGQEISVTSDVVVTCDSRGTTYHFTSSSPVSNKGELMGNEGDVSAASKSCFSTIRSKNKTNNVKCNSKRKALRITTSLISPNKERSTKNYGSCGSGRASRTSSTNGRDSIESKRERKAAKTLAIITGIFVICWLPFFIVALLSPLCGPPCNPPALIGSIFQWLGYVNSMLNPVIYTIFSADFRIAFKKILLGKRALHRSQNRV